MSSPIEQLKAEIIQLRIATQNFYFILESIMAQMLGMGIDTRSIENELTQKAQEYFQKYGISGAVSLDEEKDFLINFATILYDTDKKLLSLLEGKNTPDGGTGREN